MGGGGDTYTVVRMVMLAIYTNAKVSRIADTYTCLCMAVLRM